MSLLLPTALAGLFTLPVIVALHLLRDRRQQLPIPSLQLWRGLDRKVRGALPRNVPLSLMLLLQLAIAAAISLALARPVIPFVHRPAQHTVFVLDTSTSMSAQSEATEFGVGQTRFDAARDVILGHLEAMEQEDTAVVVGLGPKPEVLLEVEGRNKARASLALQEITPGATGMNLPAALTLVNGIVKSDPNSEVVILTDGAFVGDAESIPEMKAPLTWRFVRSPAGNQALLNVSAWTLPDGRHRLFARIANFDETPASRTVRVTVDGHDFSETAFALPPRDEVAQTWTLPGEAARAAVEIIEPDGLTLDNRAEVALEETARLRILLVSSSPDALERALEAQPGVELTVVAPSALDHDPADFDAAVFDGMPPELTALPAGNLLVVNPPLGHPLLPAQRYSRGLRPDAKTASELFAGVDLSGVFFNRVPQIIPPDWAEVDLTALSRSPTAVQPTEALVFHGAVGDTRLVVWAFDLTESNLPARLALPLLTANTLSLLRGPTPPPAVAVGDRVFIGAEFTVESPLGERHVLREDGVFAFTKQPGLYRIYDPAGDLAASFGVHAGSALESDLAVHFERDALSASSMVSEDQAHPLMEQLDLWPLFIVAVLAAVLLEGWLAWRR
jgi:Ca-activated chloride channel family protein